jgi:amino acid transporter
MHLGRDGLIPSALADINPWHKTPVKAQLWCGAVAMALSAFFNVKLLAELLDMGVILACTTYITSQPMQESLFSLDTACSHSSLGILHQSA